MTNNVEIIKTYVRDRLWRSSSLCQSIVQLSERAHAFTAVHGDAIHRVTATSVTSLNPNAGALRDPKVATDILFKLLMTRYQKQWLCRVFLISDERNIEKKFYRCPDGFSHACYLLPPNLEDFRNSLLDGIEYLDVLAIFSRRLSQCDFSNPLASIVSAFDGEGFILVERADCR